MEAKQPTSNSNGTGATPECGGQSNATESQRRRPGRPRTATPEIRRYQNMTNQRKHQAKKRQEKAAQQRREATKLRQQLARKQHQQAQPERNQSAKRRSAPRILH